MLAHPILLQKKYCRIIEQFANAQRISLDEALDFFYKSELYLLMSNGISDMHCMSDAYLVEDLTEEYINKNPHSVHSS